MDPKAPNQQDPTEHPESLSAESVEKLINEKVNAAIAGHLTRFKGAFTKDVEGMLGKSLNPVLEKLGEIGKPSESTTPASSGEKTAAEKAWEVAQAKYDARIKELEAKATKAESDKAETEARQRSGEERQALMAGLAALGVDGPRQKMALSYLYGEEKRVTRDDAGNIVFRVSRGSGNTRFDDLVSIDEGLKEWASTEEGKSVLPPRGAQGSGTTPAKPLRADGKMTKAEAAVALAHMLSRD